ncbi:MAG TPA: ABC transporter substrate-binding protein, partial [Acidimicrobiia bacterium]|nr:ABC transporter substrate-binding protein [Acidimicrobiia bacterium]
MSTAPRPGTRSPTVTAPTSPAAGATKPTSGSPAPAAPGGGPAPEAVGTPGETGPIIIGSVGNYSGPAGASVKGGVDALQAWASYTNDRGGLFGRRVQVIVQDDGGDPARYGSALRDLVETRGVVAFVYNSAALSMEGGIDYLNKKGVPVIGNDCAVEQWFNSPVFFPQCAPIADEIIGMIRAGVKTTGKTKYGFAACREAKTCEQQTPIQQRAGEGGAQLVYQGSISLTQVDFTSECRAAKSAGVEIMNLIADTATFVRFARSCNRQDFRPTYLALGIEVGGDVIAQP